MDKKMVTPRGDMGKLAKDTFDEMSGANKNQNQQPMMEDD